MRTKRQIFKNKLIRHKFKTEIRKNKAYLRYRTTESDQMFECLMSQKLKIIQKELQKQFNEIKGKLYKSTMRHRYPDIGSSDILK